MDSFLIDQGEEIVARIRQAGSDSQG